VRMVSGPGLADGGGVETEDTSLQPVKPSTQIQDIVTTQNMFLRKPPGLIRSSPLINEPSHAEPMPSSALDVWS
jgi:hypothetical protein